MLFLGPVAGNQVTHEREKLSSQLTVCHLEDTPPPLPCYFNRAVPNLLQPFTGSRLADLAGKTSREG